MPIECIKLISLLDFKKVADNKYEIEDSINKPLMLCYNSIRESDLSDSRMEYAMDIFDGTLQQINQNSEIDKIFKELDFE